MRVIQLMNGAGCWDTHFFPRHWTFGLRFGVYSYSVGLWHWMFSLHFGPLQSHAIVSFGDEVETDEDRDARRM